MTKLKETVIKFVEFFNKRDLEGMMGLYHEDAIYHQVAKTALEGKASIRLMFENEFAKAPMFCVVESIFEDEKWIILEWKNSGGCRGCIYFKLIEGRICFQHVCWD